MNELIILAILGGGFIVSSLGPLGCIALWKRFSYFGDAVAHASILGVVLGFFFGIDITIAIVVASIVFAFITSVLRKKVETSSAIMIFSYGFLSLGLFLLPFVVSNAQIDISSYLFGDILFIDLEEVLLIGVFFICTILWLYFRWEKLVLMSINEDLALSDGVNVRLIDLEYTFITALIIGISIKIIGALLVASILVIPASSAYNISKSPLEMLLFSILCGVLSIIGGMFLAFELDSPSGPSIVLVSLLVFLISLFFKKNRA